MIIKFMPNQRLQVTAFFILLGIAFLVVLLMFLPFLKLVALAGILAILLLPVHRKITSFFKSETWGSIISLILLLIILLVPLYVLGQLLFNEINTSYQNLRSGGVVFDRATINQYVPDRFEPFVESLSRDVGEKISGFAGNAFEGISNVLSNVAGFVLSFFLVFFSMYYLLRDGSKFKKYVNEIFPLSEEHENRLIKKLEDAVNGVVKGAFLIALLQGAVATVGFIIFGLPNPFLWGLFTVLAALVPNIGTAVALVPAVMFLFLSGQTGSAIGLAIWGALAVGTIDNIVSPRLVGSRVNLHPLLVLLSVLGGIHLFGIMGFLLGPIITAVFVTLLDIYRTELKAGLEK